MMTTDRVSDESSHFRTRALPQDRRPSQYYVELPVEMLDDHGSLLDSLISYTFDTLQAQHLDLRIVANHSRYQ
jgi:hypothetical protein